MINDYAKEYEAVFKVFISIGNIDIAQVIKSNGVVRNEMESTLRNFGDGNIRINKKELRYLIIDLLAMQQTSINE
ncbi:hypothetical protein ABN763_03605 [Spongiivirga sp. MCCC 1A20706]|uniref:hypothetical protein n=1 Tax=Spongiivirga sp. MCCC 1A20706 TaxID=3160963 RepID=UPI00397775D5